MEPVHSLERAARRHSSSTGWRADSGHPVHSKAGRMMLAAGRLRCMIARHWRKKETQFA